MTERLILCATDYSDASQQALQVAAVMARYRQCRLLIAHVSEQEAYPVGEIVDEPPRPNPEEFARLKRVIPPDPNIAYEHRLLSAPPTSATVHPGEEILKLAEEVDAAAIVIGTHGRSGLRRLLAGSIAESIIEGSSRQVIAVKPAAKS